MAGIPNLHHEHIFIYRLKDLREARADVERAFQITDWLRVLVDSKRPRRRAIYGMLNSEVDIR